MIGEEIRKAIVLAVEELGLGEVNFVVEHPAEESRGDYATNVAMAVFANAPSGPPLNIRGGRGSYKSPRELAEKIKVGLERDGELAEVIDKIEVAGAGFINFWLKTEWLAEQLNEVLEKGDDYGKNGVLLGKKVMVEYTDPNPFKEFHIGHLMSNGIGEALARLIEFSGAEVKRACYQGDVGMHVAKSVWGIRELLVNDKIGIEDLEEKELAERAKFLGRAYAYGATKYEEDPEVKEEINLLNKEIYDRSNESLINLYDRGRKWSLDYFETIYKKLGTRFDYYFFEGEVGKRGLELVNEYLPKGVFEVSQGAVVFKGENYGLHTRVFVNQLGLPTYEAKELGLAKEKYEAYPYEMSVVVTGNEIAEYFKVLLKVMSLIYPDLCEKTRHVAHGMLRLTSGKMSSRTGKVITGESLIDEVSTEVEKKMAEGERVTGEKKGQTVEAIAVAAIKYSMLKQSPGKDIIFDFEKSLSFEGDSGPYLLYTYARARSVLEKAERVSYQLAAVSDQPEGEEEKLIRWIYRFGEVVEAAARDLSPNLVCTYATELAQRFNTFYNRQPILTVEEGKKEIRLALTAAVAQVLKNGLTLLGIKVVKKM